jgi:hypothetical protein
MYVDMCVSMLLNVLYMCADATIYVCSCYYMFADTAMCRLDDVFIHMSLCAFVCAVCVCRCMDGKILFVFSQLLYVSENKMCAWMHACVRQRLMTSM